MNILLQPMNSKKYFIPSGENFITRSKVFCSNFPEAQSKTVSFSVFISFDAPRYDLSELRVYASAVSENDEDVICKEIKLSSPVALGPSHLLPVTIEEIDSSKKFLKLQIKRAGGGSEVSQEVSYTHPRWYRS